MSDLINPFSSLCTMSMKFNDCPQCHGGIMSFIHDDTNIDPFQIKCQKCGCTVKGDTWREVLEKWNSKELSVVETIDAEV